MSPITADLILTLLAITGVLGLGVLSVAALPWSSGQLQRSTRAWHHLFHGLLGSVHSARAWLSHPTAAVSVQAEPVTLVPEL